MRRLNLRLYGLVPLRIEPPAGGPRPVLARAPGRRVHRGGHRAAHRAAAGPAPRGRARQRRPTSATLPLRGGPPMNIPDMTLDRMRVMLEERQRMLDKDVTQAAQAVINAAQAVIRTPRSLEALADLERQIHQLRVIQNQCLEDGVILDWLPRQEDPR